ncbi:MAG: DegV family protein [Eubacteriales bacterium]|nr:DegV family protein [Eubacteriales bacterium]
MFQILTDTSANLDTAVLQQRNIHVIPFHFYVDGQSHFCENTAKFDGKAFYDAIRAGARSTTSQISPQAYIDEMTPMLAAGDDVLFVSMSSGISGSFASSQVAAQHLSAEFPQRRIRLVDTRGASLGEGLLALRAADMRDAGADIDETADAIFALHRNMCQIFTVEDLKYLRATGRVSGAAALVGSILQIKPLLKGDDEGKIVCFSKLRGRKRSIQAMAERYDELVKDAEAQTVGIAHADCPEDAEMLATLLQHNHPPREIMTVVYEPVTGSHVGPGALALFFLGDETARDRI